MKVSVNSELLTKTLKRCLLGSGHNLNPVHALVKIEARAGKGVGDFGSLVLTATTGLMQIETLIVANVEKPGLIAANARDLANASGSMPLGDTRMDELDGKKLRLTGSSGRKWTGSLGDPKAIGPTPEPKGEPWVGLPTGALRATLERVAHITADITDEERSRDGLLIEAKKGVLTAVGCGHTMCVALEQQVPVQLKGDAPWRAVIPSIALGALRDVLDEVDEAKWEKIDLYASTNQLFISGPATLVIAMLPSGDFGPWEMLLSQFPKEPFCVVQRLPLIESIKACQATSSKLDPGAFFDLKEATITLRRIDPDNEYMDTLPTLDMRPNLNLTFKGALSSLVACLKGADQDPDFVFGADYRGVLMRTAGGYRAYVSLMDVPAS